MPRYLIALGSFHHQGQKYIELTYSEILKITWIHLVSKSRIYKNVSKGTYYNSLSYNCVFAARSNRNPHVLYRELQRIEQSLGRIRTYKNARRTIDIDIMLSLDFTYSSANFFLPHHEALQRNFFVIPAVEALRSVGWPVSFAIERARRNFPYGYLSPC